MGNQPTKEPAMKDEIQRVAVGQHVNCFASLPQPLLDHILVSGTSKQDKRALRQTCKIFQQALDNSLTCIKVKHGKSADVQKLLKRVQHVHGLAVMLSHGMNSLLKQLPGHTTTLSIMTLIPGSNIKSLTSLPCLACLYVNNLERDIGLESISGLSRLGFMNSPTGSLAHLAPTLKQLRVHYNLIVGDIQQLTNLEVLECGSVSPTFFEQCRQLPLKHVSIRRPNDCSLLFTESAWRAAPTTLTRLTLGDFTRVYTFQHVSFPSHISHLQLSLARANTLFEIAATLPGLTRLDVIWLDYVNHHQYHAFKDLSKLTKLQSLGICVVDVDDSNEDVMWSREDVLSSLPDIANAVKKGVNLSVASDVRQLEAMWSQFHDLTSMETTWASYT